MNYKLIFLALFLPIAISSQTVVTTFPEFPTQTDQITITFDVTKANPTDKPTLAGYTGDVYAHTGVTIVTGSGSTQRWQHVIESWGNNSTQPKLSRIGTDKYQIAITNPRIYYPNVVTSEKITELCFVLRSSDGSQKTEDIFIPIYSKGISIIVNTPKFENNFGDPERSPVFVSPGGNILIEAITPDTGTETQSIVVYVNGQQKALSTTNTLIYDFIANQYNRFKNDVKIIATDVFGGKDSTKFVIVKNPAIKNLAPPQGTQAGINYGSNNSQATIALFGPKKNFGYVIGDFNDWKVDSSFFLNRFEPKPDSVIWWMTIPNLESGKEYAFQYLVDGNLRIYDPYTDKILDPWNDNEVRSTGVYPNLKYYPDGKTSRYVSILQTGQTPYNWKLHTFNRPAKEKLIIYELLLRDFVSSHSYKTLADTISYFKKLGVNTIELMPVNEFEGNDSWGYNPATYFAPDKYYGTKNDLKNFIDLCHLNGIAVIMDIVLNHAYNMNSMAQMYWDSANNRPAADNPWFNVQSNFQNTDAHWGNDFNHESKATQYFVDRVLKYWIMEYKIDGFRFDFTKGFGNNIKYATGDSWGSLYDADRIRLLKRMVDKVWSYDPTSILIFEHLAENSEDKELADYGILMWGNMNYNYNEATMGFNNNSNFSGISYKQRGWTKPNLVGYMESHDEERLMFKNLQYGNSSGSYNIRDLQTALTRMKLAATFFITVPGPKMIWQFGELGYDVSINEGGRLSRKPIRWNYFTETDRRKLFDVFAGLNRLKKAYKVFSTTDFNLSLNNAMKIIKLNDSEMNVSIIGNFGVTSGTITPSFQSTGKWYEFFSGDSLTVSDVNATINLSPGEYRLYTSKRVPPLNIITSVEIENEILPNDFRLFQNYPNPFNPTTTISYQIPASGHVTLKVYDMLGREVAILVDEFKQAGSYNSQLSIPHSQFSSSVYFYRISVNGFSETKKMIMMK